MSSLNNFYNEIIKQNPLLTKQEEFDLSIAARNGDKEARRKLIESNYRLVISIARKYHRKGFDFDDLLQESSTGLLTAVDRFEPERGYKFSTYACWWIKQAALQYINEKTGSLKVPTHSRILNAKIKNKIKELEKINGESPSLKEVADSLGENLNKIKYTIKANSASISFDNDDNKEKSTSLKDKVYSENAKNPADILEHQEMIQIVRESLKCLSPKEEKIIRLRFGITESSSNTKEFPITDDMLEYLNEK